MTTPSPAEGNTEDLIYEIWHIVKKDSLASSRIGYPKQYTVEALTKIVTAQNNATYEAVMEAIGEDETKPKSWSNKVALDMEWRARQIRNHFRAELRQSIAKIFKKE